MKTWRDIRTPVRELKKKKTPATFSSFSAEAVMCDRLFTDEYAKSSSEGVFLVFWFFGFLVFIRQGVTEHMFIK